MTVAAGDLASNGDLDFCYLTTRGRRTGDPHEIEIWFALRGATLYLLSDGAESADWVKNLRIEPAVSVRLDQTIHTANARIVEPATDEDRLARDLLVEKYTARYSGDLEEWRESALPVALDVS